MVSGEDLWEDLSDSDASEVKVSSKPPKISVKNKQKQHYSAVIQRRINALKVLQLQNKVMETKVIIPVTKDWGVEGAMGGITKVWISKKVIYHLAGVLYVVK